MIISTYNFLRLVLEFLNDEIGIYLQLSVKFSKETFDINTVGSRFFDYMCMHENVVSVYLQLTLESYFSVLNSNLILDFYTIITICAVVT